MLTTDGTVRPLKHFVFADDTWYEDGFELIFESTDEAEADVFGVYNRDGRWVADFGSRSDAEEFVRMVGEKE